MGIARYFASMRGGSARGDLWCLVNPLLPGYTACARLRALIHGSVAAEAGLEEA